LVAEEDAADKLQQTQPSIKEMLIKASSGNTVGSSREYRAICRYLFSLKMNQILSIRSVNRESQIIEVNSNSSMH
jgi:hypothetical protein